MEDLTGLKIELRDLRDKQQNSTTNLTVLEAIAKERHASILEKISNLESDIQKNNADMEKVVETLLKKINAMSEQIDKLNTLATQGKSSLKTLWFLGGVFAGVTAILAAWWEFFK